MNKKITIFCGLLATLFTNCENPVITDDGGMEEPQGNLTVSISQIEQTPFSALTRAEAGAVCSRLNFIVYDEAGSRLKYVNQTSDKANFGIVSFQLSEGDYQLVVLGHSSNGNPKSTDIKKIGFTNAQGFTDTFLYYGKVSVTEDPENLSVSLNRIVSLCRFVITDDFPEDAAKIRFYYTGGSGTLDATTGLGSVSSKQEVTFDLASGQKQFDLYTFLHDSEGTIHLEVTVYDNDDNQLADRMLDVPMQKNYITWVSGPFFTGGGTGSTEINVTINTDWEGDKHYTF